MSKIRAIFRLYFWNSKSTAIIAQSVWKVFQTYSRMCKEVINIKNGKWIDQDNFQYLLLNKVSNTLNSHTDILWIVWIVFFRSTFRTEWATILVDSKIEQKVNNA